MTANHTLKFGPFRFIPRQRLLLAEEKEIRIGNRALDILAALIERAGELVTKNELIACVWPNSVVEEINLRVHIAALRRALGDGQAGVRYILNSIGRGYCFVAPVTFEANEPPLEFGSSGATHVPALPVPLTRMVGRERDLEVLIKRAQTRRLVNIVGPVGVGKSTLALAAANQLAPYFKNGSRYVDLATISEPSQVAHAVGSAVELKMRSDKPDLAASLNDKHLLLVLDNCEHLIAATASLSESLLKGTHRLHILATSREALGSEAEWQYSLHPLDVPDELGASTAKAIGTYSAVRLFVERAAASLPTFELSDSNARFVAEICRRLDGIPLAIDLAAARVNLMNVRDIASHPDARFLEAINGRRTAMPRHQTMRAALDCSIERLTGSDGVLLQCLSVFRGSFSFDSAISMAARRGLDRHEVSDGLMSLTEKSLMRTHITGHMARHRLLKTTRMYVFEKLASSPDAPLTHRWHAEEILRVLRDAEVARQVVPPSQWVEDYRCVTEDARAAMKWAFSKDGDARLGEEIAAVLTPLARASLAFSAYPPHT